MGTNQGFSWECGDICGNCFEPIKDESTTTLLNIEGYYGITAEQIPVQIVDAIEYIYGISWNSFLRFSGKYSKNVYGGIETSINLCNPCVQVLSEIYFAHQRFENIRHLSSIFRRLSSFRAQQSLQSLKEQEIDDNCGLLFDNGDDDLVESFNFESKSEVLGSELEVEDKFDVSDNKCGNPDFTPGEIITKTNSEPRITRSSMKLQQQVVIKLERLSNEILKIRDGIHTGPSATKKNISPKTNTQRRSRDSLKGKVKKQKIFNRKRNETNLDNCVKEVTRGYQGRSDKGCNYKCKICGLKFKDKLYYQYKHLPKHFGKGVRKTCEICGKILTSHNSFRYHMKVFHANEEEKKNLKTPCEICGALIFKDRLKLHMKQHSNSREIFKCDKCDKQYLSKQSHGEHILTHSEEFTPHLCVQCGKTFGTEKSLIAHEMTHSEEKNYSCKDCLRKFRLLSLLRRHEATHANERQFVCHECGKTFKGKRDLLRHMRLCKEILENGVMKVKCEICDKPFKHSLSLYEHNARFHRTDLKKIYKCSFCGKILCSPSNLTIHENLHKNNPDYQPRKKQTGQHKKC